MTTRVKVIEVQRLELQRERQEHLLDSFPSSPSKRVLNREGKGISLLTGESSLASSSPDLLDKKSLKGRGRHSQTSISFLIPLDPLPVTSFFWKTKEKILEDKSISNGSLSCIFLSHGLIQGSDLICPAFSWTSFCITLILFYIQSFILFRKRKIT